MSQNKFPEGWELVKLGDIAFSGGKWNPNANVKDEFFYVDIEAVDNTTHKIVAPKQVPISEAPSRAREIIHSGDVIFSLVRPYLKNVAIVPSELDGQVASTAYCVIRPENGILSSYIFYSLLRGSFINSIKTYGNSPPSAHEDEFFAMSIPLAPTYEQRRIVDAIEQQFSRLDAAVESLQHARTKLKRERAAILKAATEGKLTENWRAIYPATESASQLLKRILEERRSKWEAEQLAKMQARGVFPKNDIWKQAYKEPEPPDRTDLPDLPEGWIWTSLDQCNLRITDGTHQPPQFIVTGIPFIFVANIVKGSISFENTRFISEFTYAQLNARCPVEYGDILYSAVGSYGVAVPVQTDRPFSFQRHIAHLKPSHLLSMDYLVFCLNSPWCLNQAHEVARGVAQKTVTLTDLAHFVIPLPPLSEQLQIVSEVEQRQSLMTQLEAAIKANMKRSERMQESILAEAFAGKLVQQDPNDEPAYLLLERIKEERAEREREERERRKEAAMHKSEDAKKSEVRPKEPLSLHEVLVDAKRPLTPDDLFHIVGLKADAVEEFYEELRREVIGGHIQELRPDDTRVYLEAVSE